MRVGIFGGTFNPIHNGHIKLAKTYVAALSLDRMLVIPTRVPPHKSGEDLIDGAHRLEMCRLAFAGDDTFEVSDIEITRSSKSYTVETLEALKRRCPEDQLYLIMGSDMFLTLHEWYRWEHICSLAVICAGAREQNLLEQLEKQRDFLESMGAQCVLVNLEPFETSSTEVRELAARGADIASLVPANVADYISRQGLYQ